ncbi:MAG: aspartyl protease [Hormoscilla sp. GUM202]|nr:aspartyl protease [Hormoscilla sp. GUM202]
MIQGEFDELGQLFFEIDLIAANGEIFSTMALLDTGFTQWLAINSQDLEGLMWSKIDRRRMITAMGETLLNTYMANVVLDGQEFAVEAIAGSQIRETIIGLPWLRTKRLLVDFPAGILTLG